MDFSLSETCLAEIFSYLLDKVKIVYQVFYQQIKLNLS